LIALIDEATGGTIARLTREDSVEENLETLKRYIAVFGRPTRVRTDRSTRFGCQIRRALSELDIEWMPTESPGDLGRAAHFFNVARETLPLELTSGRVHTLREAAHYLESVYLPRWNAAVFTPDCSNHHRPLLAEHDLDSICCIVSSRQTFPDYRLRFDGNLYRVSGLPDAIGCCEIRIEQRPEGKITARWNGNPVTLMRIEKPPVPSVSIEKRPALKPRKPRATNQRWMNGFFDRPTPPIWKLYR
jgi:hypothetical protein